MDKAIENCLFPFHFLCCHSAVTVALHKETSKKSLRLIVLSH